MGYAEQNSVEKGLRFKTRSGLIVQTTGSTTHIGSTEVYVHEKGLAKARSISTIWTMLNPLD